MRYIQPKKVQPFIILHDYITEFYKGVEEANAILDISDDTYINMIDENILDKDVANKILVVYSKVKKGG